jgi:hypothetical protein
MISKRELEYLYLKKNYSASRIAKMFKCSQNRINYWLNKFTIPKRTISEAIYAMHNPKGDPFKVRHINSLDDAFIMGIGLGLYWGEGTKSNLTSVRLGNSDPHLIKRFIFFLEKIYSIDRNDLKFGLQIFNDLSAVQCIRFWQKELKAKQNQFYKPIISPSQSSGTYRKKAKYGVLTLYFNNKKLRDILCGEIEKMRVL